MNADGVRKTLAELTRKTPRFSVIVTTKLGIELVDGPFSAFSGVVDEVNNERGKVKVMVSIFGRATPVELDFLQVQPV